LNYPGRNLPPAFLQQLRPSPATSRHIRRPTRARAAGPRGRPADADRRGGPVFG